MQITTGMWSKYDREFKLKSLKGKFFTSLLEMKEYLGLEKKIQCLDTVNELVTLSFIGNALQDTAHTLELSTTMRKGLEFNR